MTGLEKAGLGARAEVVRSEVKAMGREGLIIQDKDRRWHPVPSPVP